MNKFSPNFKLFHSWACKYARKHKKRIDIRPTFYVRNSGNCLGFCDGNTMVVARKDSLFEDTFVHEFCHLMQAVNGSSLWDHDDSFYCDLKERGVSMNSWNSFWQILKIEHDCEFRAVQLVKKWNLGCHKKYSQRANAYLHHLCYTFISNTDISFKLYYPDISDKMPETLSTLKSFKKIDMSIMELIFEKCHPIE
jgi:hypothetical protein